MREINLTQGYVAIVDDADFEYLNKYKWYAQKRGGHVYVARNTSSANGAKSKSIYMHREILGIIDPLVYVDHISRNTLDNTRANLRACSHSENQKNKVSAKSSASKYLGVNYHKRNKKWVAKIKVAKQGLYLGSFLLEEDAAKAYNEAAVKHHGPFARPNIIP